MKSNYSTPPQSGATAEFPCTGCGACCKRLHAVPQDLFPQDWILPNGHCGFLNKVNACTIYSERPPVCKTREMFKKQTREKGPFKGMNRKEYYRATAEVCNRWQEEDGIDEKYRVHID